MRKVLAVLVLVMLATPCFAKEYTVTLTDKQETALAKAWDIDAKMLQAFIDKNVQIIADNYINSDLNQKWAGKTPEEKETLIGE